MVEITGVLAMAYGTASSPDDIERYYTDIRGGRPPAPEGLNELRERYAAIGNRFPLNEVTERQARALERELGSGYRVYVGMKHSPPFIPDVVVGMRDEGVTHAVAIALAPHYSKMSIGGYIDRVRRAMVDGIPSFRFVEHWYDSPSFLDVLAGRVRAARGRLTQDERSNDLLVVTAHSLPERILAEGDPYAEQLQHTADLVAERAGIERYRIGWQSEGRTAEPWIGPPLGEIIEKAAADGHTAVVVCPAGFVSDHLEILYDLDIEAKETAERAGVAFARTESMNDDPEFIRALAEIVLSRLEDR